MTADAPPPAPDLDVGEIRRAAGPAAVLAILWSTVPAVGGFVLLAKLGAAADGLHRFGDGAIAAYVVAFAITSGLGLLPTHVQAVLGGWVFGNATGSIAALAGLTLGAIVGFVVTRLASRDRVRALLERWPKAAIVRSALLERGGLKAYGVITLLRVPPNMPFSISNLAMAGAGAPFLPYVLGTFTGMAPRTIVTASFAAAAAATGARDLQGFVREGDGWIVLLVGIAVLIAVLAVISRIGNAAIARALATHGATSDPVLAAASRPWWVDAFDDTYLSRYTHRDDDEAKRAAAALFARGVLKPGDRVLDLCCGAGRHLAAVRERGARPIGFDLSPQLLALARTRAAAPLARGDMRALPFREGSFDAAIQMFTAFGYFDSDAENRGVLREVARVLRPDGAFVLDVVNRAIVLANLSGTAASTERRLDDGAIVRERRSFDHARQRMEKTTQIEREGVVESRFESVRVFDRGELAGWLDESGFRVDAVIGDYSGAPYDEATSWRMILVARRA